MTEIGAISRSCVTKLELEDVALTGKRARERPVSQAIASEYRPRPRKGRGLGPLVKILAPPPI